MRLDRYLTLTGFAESRTKASEMIRGGIVWVDGQQCTKPSREVETPNVEMRGEPMQYVGRGGQKLAHALDFFDLCVEGKTAVDIGASTGGFTQCLLMHGAARVFAVDAGHGQLHPLLRSDSRVVSMEGINARTLTAAQLGKRCDLAVMDVSFISQVLLYPAVTEVLTENGYLISLIKPQFEVGRQFIGKKGIVRDRRACLDAIKRLIEEARRTGLICRNVTESPIVGGDGNREFLAYFDRGREQPMMPEALAAVVYGEHEKPQ